MVDGGENVADGRYKVPPLLPVKALSNYLLLFGL